MTTFKERRMKLTNRYTNANELSLLQRRAYVVDRISEHDADCHGENNPYHEEAVEEGEAFQRREFVFLVLGRQSVSD